MKADIPSLTKRLSAQIAEFQREFHQATKAAEEYQKKRGPKWKRPDASS